MDARTWLELRRTPPPVRLAARIDAALAAQRDISGMSLSEAFTTAATGIFRELIASGATERAIAIDLLAADALITYAIEAAAEECDGFVTRANDMIAQLSEVQSAGKA